MRHPAWVLAAALTLAACSAEDTIDVDRRLEAQLPGDDAVVTTHTVGPLTVTVRRPAVTDRGIVRIELTVADGADTVDGLRIVASSDMPSMAHPQELESVGGGSGRYTLDVPLGMPGTWVIDFRLSGEAYEELAPFGITFDVRPPPAAS